MADYSKVDKDSATYSKVDKTDTDKGWFEMGWFTDWLAGLLYHKVEKDVSVFTKLDRDTSSYSKTDKGSITYTKIDRSD